MLLLGQLLKDVKVSLTFLNSYIKHCIKVKTPKDIATREIFSPLMSNLISLLAEHGPLSNQGVISAFSTIVSVYPGKMSCTVTISSPLDEDVLAELMTVLIELPKSRPSIEI